MNNTREFMTAGSGAGSIQMHQLSTAARTHDGSSMKNAVQSQQTSSLFEEVQELKKVNRLIMEQLGGVAEATNAVMQNQRDEPELKNLTLEGVSLTLKDVNLTLPS